MAAGCRIAPSSKRSCRDTGWFRPDRRDTAMPTTLESRGVSLFHAHVYFDHAVPERVAQARAFMNLIRRTFAATDHVEVHSLIPFPAGPHPRGSFEVLFTREVFADYVSWLMFERPESLDILVHPLTRSQVLDHTERAFWLGSPLEIDRAVLEAADAQSLGGGVTSRASASRTRSSRRTGSPGSVSSRSRAP